MRNRKRSHRIFLVLLSVFSRGNAIHFSKQFTKIKLIRKAYGFWNISYCICSLKKFFSSHCYAIIIYIRYGGNSELFFKYSIEIWLRHMRDYRKCFYGYIWVVILNYIRNNVFNNRIIGNFWTVRRFINITAIIWAVYLYKRNLGLDKLCQMIVFYMSNLPNS